MITRAELLEMERAGKIKEHHRALCRGYVRRTGELPPPYPYKGKFGEGFTTREPCWKSTQYSRVTYWIFT